jgi:hypothetical protein
MPIGLASQNFSHAWAAAVSQVALYQSVAADGTLLEVDGSILDEFLVPVYQRRVVALDQASDGALAAISPVTFRVPAGTTICWYGLLDGDDNLLALEPISASVLSDVPQAVLFDDLTTGWISRPGASQQGGTYVVFWSDHAPQSGLFSTGGYTTLPSNIWAAGAYTIWLVREQQFIGSENARFTIRPVVTAGQYPPLLSDESRFEVEATIPSNYGWGYYQRIDPIAYVADGTFSLDSLRVRTTG